MTPPIRNPRDRPGRRAMLVTRLRLEEGSVSAGAPRPFRVIRGAAPRNSPRSPRRYAREAAALPLSGRLLSRRLGALGVKLASAIEGLQKLNPWAARRVYTPSRERQRRQDRREGA